MTKTHTASTKPTDPRTRSRWLGLLALVGFGALIAVVGIAVGQAGETGMGEPGPIVQHGPAQRLDLPKAARLQTTGASATLLPTGRWLLLGGTSTDGKKSIAAARLYDADKRKVTALKTSLLHARAYHTATLLADGRVLVLGGIEHEETLVREAEFFDPVAGSAEAAPDVGLLARARHRATLLTDARVLITGGVGDQGWAIDEAQLFDPESGAVEHFNARLDRARFSHLAALLPSHNVLVWGGIGADGAPVQGAELYDPAVQEFLSYDAESAARALAEIKSPAAPTLIDSQPLDGAEAVDGRARISLRFSKPLLVTSLNAKTIALVGPEGHVPVTITPTEGGLLAFVLPKEELLPSSDYALIVQGATDRERQALPFTAIGFKTRAFELTGEAPTTGGPGHSSPRPGHPGPGGDDPPSHSPTVTDRGDPTGQAATEATIPANNKALTQAEDGESFVLDPEQRQGHWRTGRPLPEAVVALRDFEAPHRQRIEHMRARMHRGKDGQPALAKRKGLVDDPAVTGVGGTVLRLNDQPLASVTLSIDKHTTRTDRHGRFALTGIAPGHHELVVDGRTARGREYLQVIVGVDVRKQGLTELSYAVYLPRVRASDWFEVVSPTRAEIAVTHPDLPGIELLRVPKDTVFRDRQGKILTRIALVPVPLDRSPYPTPAAFPMYFMLHPGGAVIEGRHGRGVQTIYPNTDHQPAGSPQMLWFYDPRDSGWIVYGTGHVSRDGTLIEPDAGVDLHEHTGAGHSAPNGPVPPPSAPPPGQPPCGQDGDPVDCATGLFLHARTEVSLPDDLPINMTRTYRPGDTLVRAFGKGTNHNYGMYLRAVSGYESIDLILPDGSRVNFPHTAGTVLHTDYVWEHTATPTRFYGARLTAPVDASGEHWDLQLKDGTRYTFNLSAQLINLKDRQGNQLFFTYNGGQILRITTQNGRYVDFQYDTPGRITELKDLIGRTWSYEYTTSGYLSKATYPEGTFEEYTYDSAGRMLTVRDRRGNTMVTNEYDANGRVTRQTLADGAVFDFAYTLDATGKVRETQVTDPRGHIRRRQFNAAGYITGLTRGLGTPEAQTATYTRNAGNLLTEETDALGRVTHYAYDAKGNRTQVTRLHGTPDAVSWNYTYEPTFNQMNTVTDPLGHTASLSYDAKGNLTRLEDALGNRMDRTYDAAGHLLTTTRTAGGTPLTTTFAYDGSDLVEVQDPLNRVTDLYPDAVGRIVNLKDPLGRYTRRDYDTNDRIVTRTDAQGRIEHYTYDGHGNLLTFTDARNQTTTFTYDPRDRMASKTDALLGAESYQYDPAGNLLFHTDRKGQVTGQSYDALDRRTGAGYGASSTSSPVYTSTTSYSYDAGDRLSAIVDAESGTLTRSYDNRFDTVTEEASPQGTVSYSYAADGQRTSLTPTGGTPITYSYDAAKHLTAITQGAGTGAALPATVQSAGFLYDEAQRPTRVTLPNGITLDYGYDAASELQAITYKYPNGTTLGDLTYTYDALGNRIAIGGSLARTGLPQASSDAQYDANNRLISRDGVSYTYDANGNLTSDGTSTYTWDERNQLVAVSGPDTVTYAYDGLGRRIHVTRNGQTTTTLYDGWNALQLQQGTTVIENRLMGLGLDALYARTRGGVTESYLTDALGSTVELRDSIQGQTTQYTYEPYGGTTQAATSTNIAKYTGREQDIADLYYYRNRYYKPSLGRFISEDPIRLAGGSNAYAYVENNPLRWVDPMGLAKDSITASIESAIIRGDARTLQSLIQSGGLSPAQDVAAQAGIRSIEVIGRTTNSTARLAELLGKRQKEIKRAIEQCKQENLPRGGPIRNPDVRVDPRTGHVYPELPGGRVGDPIGNILDYL